MLELLFTWIVTMGLSALACLIWLAIYAQDHHNDFRKWLVRPLRSRLVSNDRSSSPQLGSVERPADPLWLMRVAKAWSARVLRARQRRDE